jgi:hypothetical protein
MAAKDNKLNRGSRSFCLLGLQNMPNETFEHSLYTGLHFSAILNMKKVMLLFLKPCLTEDQSLVVSKVEVNMMDKDTWFKWLV